MTAAASEVREVGFTEIDVPNGSRAAEAVAAPRPRATSTYLLVPILLLFVLLTAAVIRSPSLISSAGIGSAVIVTTPLVLATYALMAVAIAGRGTVDLSVGPLIGFINVTLVQLFGLGVRDGLAREVQGGHLEGDPGAEDRGPDDLGEQLGGPAQDRHAST